MNFYKNIEIWGILLTILVCLIMAYPIIGHVLISPNDYMYTFGGDGLTIYYDMIYHVLYGNGTHFTGMNYPYGELIFMTDAQGALTQILQWINSNVFNISEHIVGIVNFLNAFSIIIGSLIVYVVLRKLDVKVWLAVVFSSLIILLSPQIFRLISHFGLAYLFVIPLCYLWVIQKQENQNIEWKDLLIFVLIVFMTFNNPYCGFIMASIVSLSGFYLWIKYRFDKWYVYVALVGLLPLMIVFSYLKIFDKVSDRLKIQWGYFDLMTLPEGIIRPHNSHMDSLLQLIGSTGSSLDFENKLNLGIVTLCVLLFYSLGAVFKIFRVHFCNFKELLSPIFFSSFVLLAYATGVFFMPFDQDFIEDKLSFMLMFKAIGRLSWPFYFSMSILAVLYINQMSEKLNKWVFIIFVLLMATVWKWEINTYVFPEFTNKKHANFLGTEQKVKVDNILKEYSINVDDYQGILSIPKIMTWTDNFISEVNWSAQYNSMNISRTTGLPIINAMLSRMSIGQTAEKVELYAHPLIQKSFVEKLDPKKDILIVLGHGFPSLSSGESFLVNIADTLYHEDSGFTLLKLAINSINNNDFYKDALKTIQETTEANVSHFYQGYNDEKSYINYFGEGSHKVTKGRHVIFFDTLALPLHDTYTMSVWTRIDNKKYGMGWFTCEVKDNLGHTIFKETPDTRRSNDVHGSWIRTEMIFPVKENCTIKVEFDTNREIIIDELLIRPSNTDIIYRDSFSKQILYNGYLISI